MIIIMKIKKDLTISKKVMMMENLIKKIVMILKDQKKNKGCDSSDNINKEAVAKNNAEEKENQQNKINKQSNCSKHSDEIALSEILKLLLKEEMDHLIVYIDQKFDILEREIGEKRKNTN